MMAGKIPPMPEAWRHDYNHDLELAKLSQMAYANEHELLAVQTGSFEPRARSLPWNWAPDKRFGIEEMPSSGFAAVVFRKEGSDEIVIAFRGSDQYKDWKGPNLDVAADGPVISEMVKTANPLNFGLHGKILEASIEGQKKLIDQWDPQFGQALDLVRDVMKAYPGYRFEVTGHSLGGALAQVAAHTYGLPGRSFDAPGAANILESDGYKQWLRKNGVAFRPPSSSHDVAEEHPRDSFINYRVNDSVVAHKTGPHLGDHDAVTGLSGQATWGDRSKQAGNAVVDLVTEIPLLGKVTRLGDDLDWLQSYVAALKTGKDISERHNMDRIVKVFEHTVERGELQRWGQDARPAAPVADAPAQAAPLITQAGHPAHAMYTQALSLIDRSDAIPAGTMTQEEKSRLAAGVVAGALAEDRRFTQIDQVLTSTHLDPHTGKPVMLIPVQGDPATDYARRAGVDIERALSSTLEQSSDISRTVLQTRQQEMQQEQLLAMNLDGPTAGGPAMKIGARTIQLPQSQQGPNSEGASAAGGGGGSG